jgi:segregation and condensation protein B
MTAERDELERAVEAVLMVAEDPVPSGLLAELCEVSLPRIEELCAALAKAWEAERRGFQLVRVAGGWRVQSHPELADYVERFALHGRHARLSAAGLETLAIVAYKQPISRAQVSSIRGVNVDGVLRTLVTRGYVEEVGRDSGPGNPSLFGTTPQFLEALGLDSLDDLPLLTAFVPDGETVEALERSLRASSSEA